MKLNVEVREEHIGGGSAQHPDSCPVALALRDCEGVSDPYVCGSVIRVRLDGETFKSGTPEAVRAFISRFDRREGVEPFSFDLEVS